MIITLGFRYCTYIKFGQWTTQKINFSNFSAADAVVRVEILTVDVSICDDLIYKISGGIIFKYGIGPVGLEFATLKQKFVFEIVRHF